MSSAYLSSLLFILEIICIRFFFCPQHDLTNKVRPLEPHKPNDIRLVKEHHDATLRMAKKYGFKDGELSNLKVMSEHQTL